MGVFSKEHGQKWGKQNLFYITLFLGTLSNDFVNLTFFSKYMGKIQVNCIYLIHFNNFVLVEC